MIHKLRKKIIEGNHMQSVKLEDSEEYVCLNCGTTFRGKHCPECRQKANTKRLDMKVTIKNVASKFITLDSGMLHTIVDLLYRPGYMVRDYINGYRIEYVEPLMLMIILLAIQYVMPTAFPEPAIQPFPKEWDTQLSPYPVSWSISKAWYWIWSDSQRWIVMFAFLFGMALSHTLRHIRVGKDHILNISESVHLYLYWYCFNIIVEICVNLVFWALPSAWADENLSSWICLIPCIAVFLIMVRDCTQIGWGKMMLFVPLYVFMAFLYLCALVAILILILLIELPFDSTSSDLIRNILSSSIPQ